MAISNAIKQLFKNPLYSVKWLIGSELLEHDLHRIAAHEAAAAFDDEGFYKMGDAVRPVDADDFSRGFVFDGRLAENLIINNHRRICP